MYQKYQDTSYVCVCVRTHMFFHQSATHFHSHPGYICVRKSRWDQCLLGDLCVTLGTATHLSSLLVLKF